MMAYATNYRLCRLGYWGTDLVLTGSKTLIILGINLVLGNLVLTGSQTLIILGNGVLRSATMDLG